ncbi:diaminopimelate decarboxylase [Cupriavidus basilensis]|uniref:Diaminopimelate decarboxylase n=1 Tax=Cupriavidus basilensis TaxID=68895 RepID=A0ABT6AQV6_9BURK|nr:diaminopimelate decarboxylase [Cupriavidus basilensis]MDF3835012.1 diaminopimelate decarboxylase [Cupriavidus basilensis]
MTAFFHRHDGALAVEHVPLARIAAEYGTPTFVYSRAALTAAYNAYAKACEGRRARVQYAMKANSNLAVLQVFAKLGAGFDIVSGGELQRVLAVGGDPRKVVFSGVGKTAAEMELALAHDVLSFNVESIPELDRLNAVAGSLGKRARVSLRINPDVDAKTHPYISTGLKGNKFGVAFEDVLPTYRAAAALPHLEVAGIDCHIGSQITEVAPYLEALDKVLDVVEALEREGIKLEHIDVGGGLGITYDDETPPDITGFARTLLDRVAERGHGHREVLFEPGRSLVGNAGVLLTQVEFLKPGAAKNFCIVDAAMNDLARPAMYEAYHRIEPVQSRDADGIAAITYDVVGPVCESGDWLGRDRALAVQPGDLLAVMSAGAYGFVMSSNYNTRPRAAEVMVDGADVHLVRGRERVEDLFRDERLLAG